MPLGSFTHIQGLWSPSFWFGRLICPTASIVFFPLTFAGLILHSAWPMQLTPSVSVLFYAGSESHSPCFLKTWRVSGSLGPSCSPNTRYLRIHRCPPQHFNLGIASFALNLSFCPFPSGCCVNVAVGRGNLLGCGVGTLSCGSRNT